MNLTVDSPDNVECCEDRPAVVVGVTEDLRPEDGGGRDDAPVEEQPVLPLHQDNVNGDGEAEEGREGPAEEGGEGGGEYGQLVLLIEPGHKLNRRVNEG